MSDRDILFLPPGGHGDVRWLRIADDRVAARGDGIPADVTNATVVVPAQDVTLHWAKLPDRSHAQSIAAARLLAADVSVSPIGDLHVAVGREAGEERPIGVVAGARMHAWLAAMAGWGIEPDAMIPAPMLLPRPETGYLAADLGSETVVRGSASGFADEPVLTDLITAGSPPERLSRDAIEAAIIAAVNDPALDLRQGSFARRRRQVGVNWALLRRIIWMAVAALTLALITTLVLIAKHNLAAERIEAQADARARQGLRRGEPVSDAARQLDERVARLRGAGQGFTRTAATLFAALRAVPGTELTAIAFDANGDLRATVSAQGEAQVTDLKTRIEAAGFVVRTSVFQASGGRVSGDMTLVTP